MQQRPTGTVTFLFTDIEGSTKRWEAHPAEMRAALACHDAILRSAIEQNGGYVFKTVGDAFCAAFASPYDALVGALATQRALFIEPWPGDIGELRVRMALHVGVVEERDGDYFGQPLNRVARLLAAGHGGQVLLSEAVYSLVRDNLPAGVSVRNLGEHRLQDLQRPEHIFQLLVPGLPDDFPPLRTLDYRPNNLPAQATPFIGREKEVASLLALLRRPGVRLVVLTGPGGSGKTRLGLQVAADLLDDFKDGVFAVELAALTDPSLVSSSVAQALGVTEAGSKPLIESLADHLGDKQLLLMLDNFEQVAQAPGTDVIDTLLKRARQVKLLVTSRVGLRLYGEHDLPVPPLSLPDVQRLPPLERITQYEAVRLFIERAQAVKPDFLVTNENAPALAEICVRLDGLPLAIELAATRIRPFPPQIMLPRLSQRLKVLTGGAVNLPARQQTLRNTIAWSYDLLDNVEKQLFRRMAVFSGGRTLGALEAVCNHDGSLQVDVADGVESLMNKSLLQQREGSYEEPRFWMLETIHEYARERLQESGEANELCSEHAFYFMRLAEEAEPHLSGPRQDEWLERLDRERDNLRQALQWVRNNELVELGARLIAGMWRLWYIRGPLTEGRHWLEWALAQDLYRQAPGLRASILNGLGTIAVEQGDAESAARYDEEALAIWRQLADNTRMTTGMNNLANDYILLGDYDRASQLHSEALMLRRSMGDQLGIAQSLNNLGEIARTRGDYRTAAMLYEEGAVIRRALDVKSRLGGNLSNLGLALLHLGEGECERAARVLHEGLAISRAVNAVRNVPLGVLGLGCLAASLGQPERAVKLLSAADNLSEILGNPFWQSDRTEYDYFMSKARARLDQAAWQAAQEEGRVMSMEQAMEYALQEPASE